LSDKATAFAVAREIARAKYIVSSKFAGVPVKYIDWASSDTANKSLAVFDSG
jgi:hypothetical protein